MVVRTPFSTFIIGMLAVWRLTHLLWAEDGPWSVFARLRRLVGEGALGRLLDCFYCLSLWVSVPFAWILAPSWIERAIVWLGLSGGAVLLERATARPRWTPPTATWRENAISEKRE